MYSIQKMMWDKKWIELVQPHTFKCGHVPFEDPFVFIVLCVLNPIAMG